MLSATQPLRFLPGKSPFAVLSHFHHLHFFSLSLQFKQDENILKLGLYLPKKFRRREDPHIPQLCKWCQVYLVTRG